MANPRQVIMPTPFDAELFAKGLAYYKLSQNVGAPKTVVVDGVMYSADAPKHRLRVSYVGENGFIPVTYKGWVSKATDTKPLFCLFDTKAKPPKLLAASLPNLFKAHAKIIRKVSWEARDGYTYEQSGAILPFAALGVERYIDTTKYYYTGYAFDNPPPQQKDGGGRVVAEDKSTTQVVKTSYFVSNPKAATYPRSALAWENNPTVSTPPGQPGRNVAKKRIQAGASGETVEVTITSEYIQIPGNMSGLFVWVNKTGTSDGEVFCFPASDGWAVPATSDDNLFLYSSVHSTVNNVSALLGDGNSRAVALLNDAYWRQKFPSPLNMRAGQFSNYVSPTDDAVVPVKLIDAVWDAAAMAPRLVVRGYDAVQLMEGHQLPAKKTTYVVKHTYLTFNGSPIPGPALTNESGVLVDILATAPTYAGGMKFLPPGVAIYSFLDVAEVATVGPTVESLPDSHNDILNVGYGLDGARLATTQRQQLFVDGKPVNIEALAGADITLSQAPELLTRAYRCLSADFLVFVGICERTTAAVVAKINGNTKRVELFACIRGEAFKFPDTGTIMTTVDVFEDSTNAVSNLRTQVASTHDPLTASTYVEDVSVTRNVRARITLLSPPSVSGHFASSDLMVIGVVLGDGPMEAVFSSPYPGVNFTYWLPKCGAESLKATREERVASMVVNLKTKQITPLKSFFPGVTDNVFPYRAKSMRGVEVNEFTVRDIDDVLED